MERNNSKKVGENIIVDSYGKAIKNLNNKNKVKLFFNNNMWNILGIGLAAFVTIIGIANYIVENTYGNSCSEYYGVSKHYFQNSNIFKDKVIFIIASALLFLYPLFFDIVNKKLKSKVYLILSFLVTIFILFMQNIVYTVNLIDEINIDWLRKLIDNYYIAIIFLISDIIIAFYLIIRRIIWPKCKIKMFEKLLLSISLFIYVVDIAIGITLVLERSVENKKSYEVIADSRVILAEYDGKFVVMDCIIDNDVLVISKKSGYELIEMTNQNITYNKYEKVICE